MKTRPIDLEALVGAYLDGDLSEAERGALELRLGDPDVATVLRGELAVRALLAESGPDEVPAALLHRIDAALGIEAHEVKRAREATVVQAALAGAAWMLRGPRLATGGGGVGREVWQPATSGFRAMRYALGPFASAPRRRAAPKRKASLTRRIVRGLWRRR